MSDPMKVLLFGQHFAEYVLTVASGFDKEVNLALILSKENFQDEIARAESSHPMLLISMPGPSKVLRFLSSLYAFHQWMRHHRPDVVHFQEMPKGFTFLCWLLSSSAKRILTIHDVTSHPGQDAKTSSRQEFIKNQMRRTADAVIVHGDALRNQLAHSDPIFPLKTFVIPHPAFRTLPVWNDAISKQHRILFFGRISQYKGLRYLLEAALILQQRHFPFMLVIAGQGDDLQANAALLDQVPSKQVINRRIAPAEIDRLFAETDLVVLPYIEASQSGVAAFALGYGKACVATSTGSLAEVVQDQFNGLICPPADAERLADCIQKVFLGTGLLQQFSRNSYALAKGRFSSNVIAESTYQAYRTVRHAVRAEPSKSIS